MGFGTTCTRWVGQHHNIWCRRSPGGPGGYTSVVACFFSPHHRSRHIGGTVEGVVEATRETFRSLVAQGLVLVDMWGPECRPCLALMPHVERIAAERPELSVVKLEAPKARRICIEMQVHGLPTFLLLREGAEVARLSKSTISPGELEDWLDESIGEAGGGDAVASG